MSQFEYVAVFVSIVAGLGVVHLLLGFTRLLTAREPVRYRLTLLWTVGVFSYLVFFWWTTFRWSVIEEWRLWTLLWMLAFAIVLYLLCAVLYPPGDDTSDYTETFFRHRRTFFGLWILLMVFEFVDSMIKGRIGLVTGTGELPQVGELALLYTVLSLGHLFAGRSASVRFHTFWAVAWIGWIVFLSALFANLTPELVRPAG